VTDPRQMLDEIAAQTAMFSMATRADEKYPTVFTALRAILDLHHDRRSWNGTEHVPSGTCNACSEREDTYDDIPWPCPTVRAITTALEAS